MILAKRERLIPSKLHGSLSNDSMSFHERDVALSLPRRLLVFNPGNRREESRS